MRTVLTGHAVRDGRSPMPRGWAASPGAFRVRLSAWVAALSSICLTSLALAADPPRVAEGRAPDAPKAVAAQIKSALESWLEGKYKIDDVRATPIPGIYEVRIATDLIYVDEKAQHAFVDGNLIDIKAGRNLTRERTEELLTINWNDLPLKLALKQVNGSGKRVVAVFEDPNCGYCKTMRRDLNALTDATVYTFVVPILAADSETKAKKALCAPDKVKAWNDLMLSNKVPENPGTCETPLAQIKELARKIGVNATPTVFFTNGKRLQGYVPPPEFEKALTRNAKG